MEMPKPTDAHRRFENMAGIWRGAETLFPSPWDPNGGTATGQTKSRVALDGFTMIGDYQQERNGVVTFRGHVVWTYDVKDQNYVMYWWDNMGSAVNVFRGNFDGDKLTMTCTDYSGNWRLTYDYSMPDTLKSKLEMSQDGQNWAPFIEGEYHRVAAEEPKPAPAAAKAKKPMKKKPAMKKAAKVKKKPAKPMTKKAKSKRR